MDQIVQALGLGPPQQRREDATATSVYLPELSAQEDHHLQTYPTLGAPEPVSPSRTHDFQRVRSSGELSEGGKSSAATSPMVRFREAPSPALSAGKTSPLLKSALKTPVRGATPNRSRSPLGVSDDRRHSQEAGAPPHVRWFGAADEGRMQHSAS
eukprot:CAMPEP_0172050114 /NCGR_PEP_ID=MMETSP1043-20130122/2434_1 /TAXON_ID=464988 /ORGANISM="Hemiselmis andersenii, Strain CCMP441" /LENGTH=154 /DNA_ID=CAMNT_0012709143 /DNA_START=49 /DNA_END=509 /DNA_ORIENTATION=+